MGCSASTAASGPAPEMPESVAYFFNGDQLAGKTETTMSQFMADNVTLEFIGPYAPPVPVLDKEHIGGALSNLIASFPDFTFNFTKLTPTYKNGAWAADIIVMGTHTGAPFTPMPGKLPAIEKTEKQVKIGPETFSLYVDAEGKISRITIEVLEKGKPAGPPGFYTEIGGVLPAPPPTVFQTPESLGAPTKEMAGAKMWIFTHEGKKMSRIAIEAGFDWKKTVAPMLPGCPEWCPATHFGYLESGEMGVKTKDGGEYTIKAGQSYLIPPGHLPVMDKDAVMVEFSQDETYAKVLESK